MKTNFEKVKLMNRAKIPFPNVNEDWVEEFLKKLTPDSTYVQQWNNPTSFGDSFKKITIQELQLAISKLKRKVLV